MKLLVRVLVLVLGAVVTGNGAASAQGPNAFSVSGLSNLAFGSVFTGYTASVAPSASSAALFRIAGPKHTQVAMAFELPSALSGPQPLPIVFGAGSAVWSDTNSPAGGPSFDPSLGITLAMPNSRTVYVWLGGTISPTMAQPTGTYSSTITMSVALN